MSGIILQGLSTDELIDRLTDSMFDRLRPLLEQAAAPAPAPLGRRLVDTREMARIASTSESTIARLTASNAIPSVKVGTSRRYDPDAVLDALAVKSTPEPESLPDGVQHIKGPVAAVLDRYGIAGGGK